MLQFCSRWSFNFAQAKKYVIVKSHYLVEAPPSRPTSSFISYLSETTKGKKQEGGVGKASSKVSEAWKALSSEHKSVYDIKSKESRDSYQNEKTSYV